MQAYEIFKHSERGLKVVKRGFSWPGFFFSSIWALAKGLWIPGILLVIVSLPLAVLIREAFSAGTVEMGYFFRIVLGLALATFVGLKGNSWLGISLERRGYRYLGAIQARSAQDAIAKVTAAGGSLPAELRAPARSPGLFSLPTPFQQIIALIALTWKAAFRYRLFWVLTFLLLTAVVGLPLLIKDDGTAEGFTQILLTYTLGAVTGILGLCTLWLACGTLARDIEECQVQMVAVKPVARWQIWLGKWLGLVTLNAVLLAISGLSIYGLLEWRAHRLPEDQQFKLKNEVLVARASARQEGLEKDIDAMTDRIFRERMEKTGLKGVNPKVARQQVYNMVRAEAQVVPPDGVHPWLIHLGNVKDSLKGEPLFLRIKFNTADNSSSGTYYGEWQVGVPPATRPWVSEPMSLSPDSYHEFIVPPDLFNEKGDLYIFFHNANQIALLFPVEDGMEVLYRQGSFGLNFVRALGIILSWTALLGAVGLSAASFLSFPVAAFFSLALLTISLSSGTLSNVVQDGTLMGVNEEQGIPGHSAIDAAVIPIFKGMLEVIQLVQQFSPIDALSTGRMITWSQLGLAIWKIVILVGGIIGGLGIFIFSRRELATAQGTH